MTKPQRATVAVVGIILVVAALIGCWYAEENDRGARAWEKTRHDLEARGESLDAAHFVPPPVPDDQNLAMAPVFARLYDYQVDPATGLLTFGKGDHNKEYEMAAAMPFGSASDGPQRPSAHGDWMTGHPLDLGTYQTYYQSRKDFPHSPTPQPAANDLLLALSRYRSLLDEVAQAAADRPLSRFPVNWTQRPVWRLSFLHGSLIQSMSQALRLRACASLALDRTDDALRDMNLGWRLNDAMSQESTLISSLIAVTGRSLLMQPAWEGLAARRWSAVQLAALQTQLGAVDLLREFQRELQCERATFTVSMRDEWRRPGGFRRVLSATHGYPPGSGRQEPPIWDLLGVVGQLSPHGWADSAAAFACEWQQDYAIGPIDVPAHRVSPGRFEAGLATLDNLPVFPTTFLVKFYSQIYGSLARRNARIQAAVNEAVTACALERYFLDHQAYPADLPTLVPTYLPRVPTDVIDGAPLRYQPTPDGRYRLWEVGWNGRDEGGTVAWNTDGKRPDDKQGDWVWQYEPLAAPGDKKP